MVLSKCHRLLARAQVEKAGAKNATHRPRVFLPKAGVSQQGYCCGCCKAVSHATRCLLESIPITRNNTNPSSATVAKTL